MPFGWGAPDSKGRISVYADSTKSPMPFGWGAPDSGYHGRR